MIKKISDLILSSKPRFRTVIDSVKFHLRAITEFFDYIETEKVASTEEWREIDVPISEKYNAFLSDVENDTNLIKTIQEEIKFNLLASWNNIESGIEDIVKSTNPYDSNFLLENNDALELSDRLTLGVKTFSSSINQIKDKPVIITECSDRSIPIYYGKMFGTYIEGNESGEDGIRPENNDGNLIIDNLDTFWEAEAVILQESMNNTVFTQKVFDKDISLTSTIKIVFEEPQQINMFKIKPYGAANSCYYKITKLEVSNGITIIPINISETYIMKDATIVFDIPDTFEDGKIKSIFVTLKQESGYFMKYDLGYFKLQNNESWVDITGPHLTKMATDRGPNFNTNVSYFIDNIENWILHYWLPGVKFNELPALVTNQGTDGFKTITSSESKRKRYSIGITDIDLGFHEYYDRSEKITKPIEIPDGYSTIELETVDTGNVIYQISFDNGMTWGKILPSGKEPVRSNDLRLIPNKLYINSDLSKERKRNTDTGEEAFIDTPSKNLRIRFLLEYDKDNKIIPVVYNWNVKFGVTPTIGVPSITGSTGTES